MAIASAPSLSKNEGKDERLSILGERRLVGTIPISGAKNSAVAVIPAALLAHDVSCVESVPRIHDVEVMVGILHRMGVGVQWVESDTLEIDTRGSVEVDVPYDEAKRLRGSALLLGPLLARFGTARVPLPGGCDIGSRPVDLHMKGMIELGARVRVEHGFMLADAPDGLAGNEIYLDFPSVGATENIMMAAVGARGHTLIYNAAKEPEVVDLANFLTLMGARVVGAGTDIIKVEGTGSKRSLRGVEHTLIPDRIEAGTYLMAGLATGGDVVVERVIPKHLESLLAKLEETGAEIEVKGDAVRTVAPTRPAAIQIKTLPYPGFPTDLQPQLTAYLLRAEGTSIISERIFEDRFGHVDELKRLGAQVKTDGNTGVVIGVERLSGAPLSATDLRMGAALILGGLSAHGETLIDGMECVDRGYEALEEKLKSLGGEICRIAP